MKKFIFVTLLALPLVFANIKESKAADNIWVDCGIGAMIFNNGDTEIKWAAVISNLIWDWGTTATSSKISSEDTCSGGGASAALFIKESYKSLEEEIAIGKGDHTTALLNIMGCESSSHDLILGSIRSDFSKVVGTTSKENRPEALFNVAINNASTCSL